MLSNAIVDGCITVWTTAIIMPSQLSSTAGNFSGADQEPNNSFGATQELTNSSRLSPWAHDYPLNTYYMVAIYTVCICGLLGNILVIGSVIVHKKLRVLSNIFIVNLAIADFCVIVVVDIFTLLGIHTKGVFFFDKPILCEFLGVICITSCACSLWSIAAIAINRYICICHRLFYLRLFNKKTMPYFVIALWIISFFVDFPNLVGWGRHGFDERLLYCTYDLSANLGYSIYLAVFLVTIPFILLTIAYLRIMLFSRAAKKRLKKHQKNNGIGPACSSTIRLTDLRLLKSVLIIWITYTLLWLPYLTLVLFDQKGLWGRTTYVIVNALAHSSSSTNSLIYPMTNKNFREAYIYQLKLLCCFWICNDDKNMTNKIKENGTESLQNAKENFGMKRNNAILRRDRDQPDRGEGNWSVKKRIMSKLSGNVMGSDKKNVYVIANPHSNIDTQSYDNYQNSRDT